MRRASQSLIQLHDDVRCQPSGMSHGVGKTRHSPVSGFRAGASTCMHATGGAAVRATSTSFPSGKIRFTAPTAIGAELAMRNDPMKFMEAFGKYSVRSRLTRP